MTIHKTYFILIYNHEITVHSTVFLFILLSVVLCAYPSGDDKNSDAFQLSSTSVDNFEPGCQEQTNHQTTISGRYEAEIQKYEEQDKQQFPPKGAELFVGSSSIRLWKSLKDDFLKQLVFK